MRSREGLTRFLDDGRIKLDNCPVESSIVNRTAPSFTSVIETCKPNDVDPIA